MSSGSGKNTAASVRQRLSNLAKARGIEFQRILILYALERLLYRLSVSPFADRFILKGASLFSLWLDEPHRRTRDMDLLGKDAPDPARFAALFQDLCALPVSDDGMRFAAETVKARMIREDNEFGGVRVTLTAFLENARIAVQVDIGFGDAPHFHRKNLTLLRSALGVAGLAWHPLATWSQQNTNLRLNPRISYVSGVK